MKRGNPRRKRQGAAAVAVSDKRNNDCSNSQSNKRTKITRRAKRSGTTCEMGNTMPSLNDAAVAHDPSYDTGDDFDYDDCNDEMGDEVGDESSSSDEEEEHQQCDLEVALNKRRMELIKVYRKGAGINKNESTLRTLTKSLRKIILPELKFLGGSKVFGSFDLPDFTDPNCWQNKLYANIPSLRDATDSLKAEVWMTYRAKLKEQFSLHRSGVTLKIKKKFEEGKNKKTYYCS